MRCFYRFAADGYLKKKSFNLLLNHINDLIIEIQVTALPPHLI